MADRIKVLYISGHGRSGSTILDRVLSQVEGFFAGGELFYLRDRGLIEKRLCGCGDSITQCALWADVLSNAFGYDSRVDHRKMADLLQNYPDKWHSPYLLLPWRKSLAKSFFADYMVNIEKLYLGIQRTTGCKVIVDSSKRPYYGYVLHLLPSIDLRVVHLVRDSRAVAYSWLRKKRQLDKGDDSYLPRLNVFYSSFLWGYLNSLTEVFSLEYGKKYRMLRYEDFVDNPKKALNDILAFVGESDATLPLVGERDVKLGMSHTVSGNPDRFTSGVVTLRQDDEWKSKMRKKDRTVVTGLTWPLLAKYGYEL